MQAWLTMLTYIPCLHAWFWNSCVGHFFSWIRMCTQFSSCNCCRPGCFFTGAVKEIRSQRHVGALPYIEASFFICSHGGYPSSTTSSSSIGVLHVTCLCNRDLGGFSVTEFSCAANKEHSARTRICRPDQINIKPPSAKTCLRHAFVIDAL